jgi:hypothetical protein
LFVVVVVVVFPLLLLPLFSTLPPPKNPCARTFNPLLEKCVSRRLPSPLPLFEIVVIVVVVIVVVAVAEEEQDDVELSPRLLTLLRLLRSSRLMRYISGRANEEEEEEEEEEERDDEKNIILVPRRFSQPTSLFIKTVFVVLSFRVRARECSSSSTEKVRVVA